MVKLLNPYVFIVGCPRSGTTLLQRLLDSHPELAVSNDTHFIPRVAQPDLERSVNPVLTEEIVERTRSYRRFYRLEISDDHVYEAARGARTYRGFVCNLYTRFAFQKGKRLAGEKTPDYGRYIASLHALFPWARFVHIIRDGRDVALSTIDWVAKRGKGPGKWTLWRQNPVAASALWWRWQVGDTRIASRDVGRNYVYEVMYEDLVADPLAEMKSLLAFLDLSNAPLVLESFEGKAKRRPWRSAKAQWLPPTPGLRNWRSDMTTRDISLFEAIAGDLLKELGYERSGIDTSSEILAEAASSELWWRQHNGRIRRRQRLVGGGVAVIPVEV